MNKVIIVKKPDGSCDVYHPTKEMMNPNSRTIRLLESTGVVFPSVIAAGARSFEKCEAIKGEIKAVSEEMVSMMNLALNPAAEQADKAAAQRKVEKLKAQAHELGERLKKVIKDFDDDRASDPEFSLEQFQEEALQHIIKRDVPAGAEYRVTVRENLPKDRYFRNAWTDHNPTETVDVDMAKARNIHREEMRMARQPQLSALDVEYQRVDERGDSKLKAVVAGRKQELRDVTKDPGIDKASTPEELKKVWPEFLGERNVL
jgi:hypothetical protein